MMSYVKKLNKLVPYLLQYYFILYSTFPRIETGNFFQRVPDAILFNGVVPIADLDFFRLIEIMFFDHNNDKIAHFLLCR